MKRVLIVALVCVSGMCTVQAQKVDDARMERDIAVAENVLSTLVKQQFGKRNFFPFEVNGTYMPGYGVTFRLPGDAGPMVFAMKAPGVAWSGSGDAVIYSPSVNETPEPLEPPNIELTIGDNSDCKDCKERDRSGKRKNVTLRKTSTDSAINAMNQKIIEASKEFLADYGDFISQLAPDERIVITNRGEGRNYWFGQGNRKQHLISIEASKSDISALKQNKLSRAQFMSKVTVVNSETSEELAPDLELFSSIFQRLYRPDLSKTYYTQENVYYERMKDYGAIFYMQVYSSNENDYQKFSMPTLGLEDLDRATRDKKVTELYPAFEKDLKESILDYGRTLKSLKDTESLIFSVRLTKCVKCGIPASVEISVSNSVLKDYASGKLTKEAALNQFKVKKGELQ